MLLAVLGLGFPYMRGCRWQSHIAAQVPPPGFGPYNTLLRHTGLPGAFDGELTLLEIKVEERHVPKTGASLLGFSYRAAHDATSRQNRVHEDWLLGCLWLI